MKDLIVYIWNATIPQMIIGLTIGPIVFAIVAKLVIEILRAKWDD